MTLQKYRKKIKLKIRRLLISLFFYMKDDLSPKNSKKFIYCQIVLNEDIRALYSKNIFKKNKNLLIQARGRYVYGSSAASRKHNQRWKHLWLEKKPHCNGCNLYLTDVTATVDHIVPVSQGGDNKFRNTQLLCVECHVWKTKQDENKKDEGNFPFRDLLKEYSK